MKIDEKVNANLFVNRQKSKTVLTPEKIPTLPNVQPKLPCKIP